jgi:hypothetical protein
MNSLELLTHGQPEIKGHPLRDAHDHSLSILQSYAKVVSFIRNLKTWHPWQQGNRLTRVSYWRDTKFQSVHLKTRATYETFVQTEG